MTHSVNSREIVLETLLYILKDGEYSHIALAKVLEKYQYLEKQERAFITRLTEGTLERMIELDAIINEFSDLRTSKMKLVIRLILRMGVYQLKYMDRVPDSAVCNEAVKLAKKKGFRNLAGFVNGVLRNIARHPEKMEIVRKDPVENLSVRYSMPEWILRQWILEYGFETAERMSASFLEEHPICIRCNLKLCTPQKLEQSLAAQGVQVARIPALPYAFYIRGYDYLAGLKSFEKGWFFVQDLSSMQVAEWADPQPGNRVLDVCAAPGGKALHIAEKMNGTGCVVARDLTEYKVDLIRENITRCHLDNIRAECMDARVLDEEWREEADIVIADLPCSGLGVLGKKTDLKYKMTVQMQEELVKLQQKILSVVQAYVKPGGKLVYSTCTVHKKENEENTRWFLRSHPEFSLVREQQILPGAAAADGFYIALLRREQGPENV